METSAAAKAGPGYKGACCFAFSNAIFFLAYFVSVVWAAIRKLFASYTGWGCQLIRTQMWKALYRSQGLHSANAANQRKLMEIPSLKISGDKRSKPSPTITVSFSFQSSRKAKHFFLLSNQAFPYCNRSSLMLVYEIQNCMLTSSCPTKLSLTAIEVPLCFFMKFKIAC